MTDLQIQIAFAAGYAAAEEGKSRAPAQSKVIMQMVRDNNSAEIGASIPLFDAYAAGYKAQCDAEAAAILAD